MLEILLDSEGRLIEFNAQPEVATGGQERVPDWERLFVAAGLDRLHFTAIEPVLTPRSFSDVRMAWTSSDNSLHGPLRVEAAGYQG